MLIFLVNKGKRLSPSWLVNLTDFIYIGIINQESWNVFQKITSWPIHCVQSWNNFKLHVLKKLVMVQIWLNLIMTQIPHEDSQLRTRETNWKFKDSFSKKENNKQQEWKFLDSCYWGLHTWNHWDIYIHHRAVPAITFVNLFFLF